MGRTSQSFSFPMGTMFTASSDEPALIRKFHEAKIRPTPVTLWETGQARREFLHADDCANILCFLKNLKDEQFQNLLNNPTGPLINIGSGEEISILELTELVKNLIGASEDIIWDSSKPDGTPKRRLDMNPLNTVGCRPTIPLTEGIKMTYEWYLTQKTAFELALSHEL